jgi:hypothetical protein
LSSELGRSKRLVDVYLVSFRVESIIFPFIGRSTSFIGFGNGLCALPCHPVASEHGAISILRPIVTVS